MTFMSPPTPRTPPPRVSVPGRSPLREHSQNGNGQGPAGDAGVGDSDVSTNEDGSPTNPSSENQAPTPQRTGRSRLSVLLLWLSAIGLGALVGYFAFGNEATVAPDEVDAAIDDALSGAFSSTTTPPDRGPAIYGTIFPSLVFIQVEDAGEGGLGSGVIINADGSIMTSEHVVAGATEITLTFTDGTRGTAQVVEAMPELDIAILQSSALPDVVVPATFGGTPAIGSRVYAVGNPLGLSGSISTGVISATGRTIGREDGAPLEDLIQFDAAVNPGSSGGPLLDENAQLIGIVTALANPTGEDFFSGIGFAVPIQNAAGAEGPDQ